MTRPAALPKFGPTLKLSTNVLISHHALLARIAPKMAARTSKRRILVVDDDSQFRRVLRPTFEANGYEVEETPSGEGALEQCRTAKYDLILLDVNLPGMSGLNTCKELRGISDARVIMLTVRDASEDKIEALDAGAHDYITKPFAMRELLARIRAILLRDSLPVPETTPLKFDRVEINFESRSVTVGGKRVGLTLRSLTSFCILPLIPTGRFRTWSCTEKFGAPSMKTNVNA
jgi:two-component system KDP operon response regulator KdpE